VTVRCGSPRKAALLPQDPLFDLLTELSDAGSTDQVVDAALGVGRFFSGAESVVVALADEAGTHFDLAAYGSASSTPPVIRLRDDLPITRAVLTGEVTVDPSPSAETLSLLGMPSETAIVVALPLDGVEGTAGSIAFAYQTVGEELATDTIDRAAHVASRVGRALEHTRRSERERRLVSALRAEMLSPDISTPTLEIHGRYLSPWSGVPLGGDWFDAFSTRDGRVVAVLGDVAGHGIASSPAMLSVRSYVRAIAFDEPDPATVLARLDRVLAHFDTASELATLAVSVFDPAEFTLSWVNGGLPPPVLRRADGTVSLLGSGRARLVGTGIQRRVDAGDCIAFGTGDTIVFLTDGVLLPIGGVGVDIDDVRRAVAVHGSDTLEVIGEAILGLSEHGDLRLDDATLLALRAR
jgi:serine phosphatase RsbU (regulator of sigma subunit)